MEIKLDAEAAASIASAAIFDSLSQDARDSVIKTAIEFLLTPEKNRNNYGAGETPLQQAFNNAIREVAFRIVKEKIENDPQVEEAILDLLGPLLTSAMKVEGENYESKLADAIGQALGVWLSNQARRD